MAVRAGIDMETRSPRDAIAWQAEHCRRNSSSITARVVQAMLPLLDSDTLCGRRMAGWHGLTAEDAMPLRLAGGFHHLHLTSDEPRLAPIYSGAIADQPAVDLVIAEVTSDHDARLLTWLDGPPQTNEAGRSAGIMAQLLWLSPKLGHRFALHEIGSSAGINTMLDRFHFDLGGVRLGPPDSPVQIAPEWRGEPPPCEPVEIVSIAGCDVSPIDLRDPAQALRLKSYVWPEIAVRMDRLDAAIGMARGRPPMVAECDAKAFVEVMLETDSPAGVTRVLFHSIVWQYLPSDTRQQIEAAMSAAGEGATIEHPLAWVMLETNRETFRHELRCRYWPGGAEWTLLGEAHAHGAWVEWYGVKSAREIPSMQR